MGKHFKLYIDFKSMAEGYENGLIFLHAVTNGKVIHHCLVSKTTKSISIHNLQFRKQTQKVENNDSFWDSMPNYN